MLDDYFRMLVCGPSACGKSETVFKLFPVLKDKYDYFYLICPTVHQNLYQKRLIFDKKNIYEKPTDESFNKVMEEVEKNAKNNKKSLILCDDILYTELSRQNSALCETITRLRHYKASIIILCQHYKAIPPVIRNNLTHMIIFNLANRNAEKVLFEEQSDKFKELYYEYTKEKYKYLYCDFTKNEFDPERYNQTF